MHLKLVGLTTRAVLLAGFGGIVIGVAAAFVLEALDQAVRTPADLEANLALPLLGAVPTLK